MLIITYPLIGNFILYRGYGKNFNKTVKLIKYLINRRYSENKFPGAIIKFDFKKNMTEIFYKKQLKLKPLKKIKIYKIQYSNITLYKVETKGKTYKKGCVFEEISKNYVSPPFKVLFYSGGGSRRAGKKLLYILVKTYDGKVVQNTLVKK